LRLPAEENRLESSGKQRQRIDIADAGRFAILTDPQGAVFAIFQARTS